MKVNHSQIAEGLMDHIPDAIIAFDPAGIVLLWSRGASEMFGYAKEEAQGQSLNDLVIPADRLSELKEQLETVLRSDSVIYESRRRRKDGSVINVDISTRVVRDENGEVLYLLSTTKERNSEAQYRMLFDSNPQPMWVYDTKSLRFLAVNEAAIRHYGYSRSEFMAMTIKSIRTPDTIPALLKETALDTEAYSNSGVWRHKKKDSSLIDVEVTSHGIVFGGKQAQLVLALDVTEKLKARYALQEKADELASMTQQLWHASKLVTMGELAASVAHELNNPLATVSLRVESLMTQLAHDEQKLRSLEIIISEVERMANLVTNLLQFTRRNYRQISTIDVRQELARSIDLISYYLRNRRINVVREFDETLAPIHADRQQLRQVFLNLMTNAGDAMPEGGVLTVRVHDQSDSSRVVIEFADTGQGISTSDLKKVWEPFFTSKPEGKGAGLGLSICSRIIEEHGGAISLESEVGTGTTVRLALPTANAQLVNKAETPSVTGLTNEEGPDTATPQLRSSLKSVMRSGSVTDSS